MRVRRVPFFVIPDRGPRYLIPATFRESGLPTVQAETFVVVPRHSQPLVYLADYRVIFYVHDRTRSLPLCMYRHPSSALCSRMEYLMGQEKTPA